MRSRFLVLVLGLFFLLFLPFRPVVFGQEGLEVVSHLIRVNQGLREGEEKTLYYGVVEELEIVNRSPVLYRDDLVFWVGEGEDLKAVAGQVGGNDVNLETKLEEGLVYVRLKEGVFIQPGGEIRVGFDYKVFFTDDQKEEVFGKKILYSHARESLQFRVNSVENLGFRPQLEGFPFKKDEQESGWFISPLISPKPGDVYRLRITREEIDGQKQEEVKGLEKEAASEKVGVEAEKGEIAGGEREPIVVGEEVNKFSGRVHFLSNQVGEWSWKEILAIFLLNDILVFGLIGWRCGWFKDSDLGQLFSAWQQLRRKKRRREK